MSNIYESPQAQTRRHVFSTNDNSVTLGMVEGIEKGAKWAKYIVYMLYFYMVLAILGMLAVGVALAMGSLSGIMAQAGMEGFTENQGLLIGVTIVVLIIVAVMCYLIFKSARAMKAYSNACNAFSDSQQFEDLEACYRNFADYTKFTFIMSAAGAIIGALVLLGM